MKNPIYLMLLFITMLSLNSCYYEDIDDATVGELIAADSELYILLTKVAAPPDEVGVITCVEIIYPISITTYNARQQPLTVTSIQSNDQFSTFLGEVPIDNSISVSYPIAAQLADGTAVNITTNAELKESIDACVEDQEQRLGECENLLNDCTWKVGYSKLSTNEFLGATLQETQGATDFNYEDITGTGSWTALFIDNELYINISLASVTTVEETFNKNWKVEYLDLDSIKLTNGPDEIIIHRYCDIPLDECTDLDFEACEDPSTPGFTDLLLDDYRYCIYQILQHQATDVGLSFHISEAEATNNTAPIDSLTSFRNVNPIETYYVRVAALNSSDFYVVPISITIDACE